MDAVYRTTEEGSKNPFKAIQMAHVDFVGSPKVVFTQFSDRWIDTLTERVPVERLEKLDTITVEMIHLWIPLNRQPANNTLAIAETNSIMREDLRTYTAVRRDGSQFFAKGLIHNSNQTWNFNPDIVLGDGYVFYSRQTPHAAVDLESGSVPRQSIEFRVFLLNER